MLAGSGVQKIRITCIPQKSKKCWLDVSNLLHGRDEKQKQSNPGLDLQGYAGLSTAGAVGTVYSVEYVIDLAQTKAWHCLTFLQLPATKIHAR